MMMITGQKPIKRSKQGQFQIVDIVDMMRPLTKYTRQIVNVNMIPSIVREAFRQAEEERPGGVHLELPEDIAAEPVDADTPPVFEISKRLRGDADQTVINDAVTMIKEAKHPLLLIGAGANRKRIWNALSKFLDQTGIPFSTPRWVKAWSGNCTLCLWVLRPYLTGTTYTVRSIGRI